MSKKRSFLSGGGNQAEWDAVEQHVEAILRKYYHAMPLILSHKDIVELLLADFTSEEWKVFMEKGHAVNYSNELLNSYAADLQDWLEEYRTSGDIYRGVIYVGNREDFKDEDFKDKKTKHRWRLAVGKIIHSVFGKKQRTELPSMNGEPKEQRRKISDE